MYSTTFFNHLDNIKFYINHNIQKINNETLIELNIQILENIQITPKVFLINLTIKKIFLKQNPLNNSLKEQEMNHTLNQYHNNLHSNKTVTHDTNTLTLKQNIIIPTNTIKNISHKLIEPFDLKNTKIIQYTHHTNHYINNILKTNYNLQLPPNTIEFTAHHLLTKTNNSINPILFHNPFKIQLNLKTQQKKPQPFNIKLEKITIHIKKNITKKSKISILSPHTTKTINFFEDNKIIKTNFKKLDSTKNSQHPHTNHNNTKKQFLNRSIFSNHTRKPQNPLQRTNKLK